MARKINEEKLEARIFEIQRNLAIVVAILIFMGQLSIIGVFVTPRGFRVTLAGPLTGSSRIKSVTNNPVVNMIIDIINIAIAKMLIIDQFRITGTVLTHNGFTINCGGPLLGTARTQPKIPRIISEYDNLHDVLCRFFNIDPKSFK
ncbi:hypothetical protein KS419_15405 [Bacillus tamaricis]|uniref:Uncharacterized protein n=1 Tax=Evansella tamaricis TaxID=2069301 RepID=A0ABS6JHW5_9BACI|nr:hypothetical protein [Evansella tamaricis]MBU9713118.1 hypothetical protein [Evansella tamaricis]